MIRRCYKNYRGKIHWRQGCALVLALHLALGTAFARPLTTPQIAQETALAIPVCMQWMIIGLCFWITCGPTGCTITVSVLIGNYNPDLVISGYQRIGENPWIEMAALYGPAQTAAAQSIVGSLSGFIVGNGDRANEKLARSHEALNFQEADAIGHPIDSLWDYITAGTLPGGSIPSGFTEEDVLLICPSETSSFVPYLLSGFDALAWRWSIPEALFPQSWIFGLREIGLWPLNSWQAVYPRSGFTIQDEPPKAGAIVSQRAGDIVTREFQPHVYIPTSFTRPASPGVLVFWPGPLFEVTRQSGYFQMHSPYPQPFCEVFGLPDNLSPISWADFKVDPQDDYAWTLWRPYKCCKIEGQHLLYVEQFVDWPL